MADASEYIDCKISVYYLPEHLYGTCGDITKPTDKLGYTVTVNSLTKKVNILLTDYSRAKKQFSNSFACSIKYSL